MTAIARSAGLCPAASAPTGGTAPPPGGPANPNDVNIAVSLSAIIEASAYISAAACEPDAYRPYCRDIKSVAPAPNLVFFDWDRTDLTAEAQLLVRALACRTAVHAPSRTCLWPWV